MNVKTLALVAACLVVPAMARAQAAAVTSKGPDCPRGCPTSHGAAGLTGVQFLALQQELRDRGCGNNHVTGVLDAPTKKAIKTCAKQLNVANNATAVLNAFDVGFTGGEGAGASASTAMPNATAAANASETGKTMKATRSKGQRGRAMKAKSAAKKDSTKY